MNLTKAEYEAGVAEFQTRFVVACKACHREEVRSPLLHVGDLDAERSPPAKRLRATCKGKSPRPCKFQLGAKVIELTHAQAIDLELCQPAEVTL